MDRSERNQVFTEKAYLIDRTLQQYRGLIRYYRLEPEDIYQELAINLLNTLDRYQSDWCPNLDAYCTLQLRYTLFHLLPYSKRHGIPQAPRKGVPLYNLDAPDQYGRIREIPAADSQGNPVWIEREIIRLPKLQRTAVNRLLSGRVVRSTNKNLIAVRMHLQNCVKTHRDTELWGDVCA